jgi:hypothetical protein
MHHRNTLSEGACDCIDSRQLANTECGYDGSKSSDSSVSVRSIAGVELVTIANPVEAAGFDIVECKEIEVSW